MDNIPLVTRVRENTLEVSWAYLSAPLRINIFNVILYMKLPEYVRFPWRSVSETWDRRRFNTAFIWEDVAYVCWSASCFTDKCFHYYSSSDYDARLNNKKTFV